MAEAGPKLAERRCVPCEGGTPPLTREAAERLLPEVPGWTLVELEDGRLALRRTLKFKDFKGAWAFFDRVAELAEREGHHPDFLIRWNRVTLTLTTHAIRGLSENDFILAAKVNALLDSPADSPEHRGQGRGAG